MVGQKLNKQVIAHWVLTSSVPQFLLILGESGSGKRTIAHYLSDLMGKEYIRVGIKVEDIREMIHTAYTTKGVYVIEDADTMSQSAKNAMLKIVEEPPKDTYFIMTVSDSNSVLDTIYSRARVLTMQHYTTDELAEIRPGKDKRLYDISTVPTDIDKLTEYRESFLDFVELFIDNIRDVESANAFKSGTRLALKSDVGYDPVFFLKIVTSIAVAKGEWMFGLISGMYESDMSKVGANKQQVFDAFVMDVRRLA